MTLLHEHVVDFDEEDRKSRVWLLVILAVFAVVILVLGGMYWWYQRQVDPPGEPGPEVTVEVSEGMGLDDIGRMLQQEGVITNSRAFRIYSRLQGAGTVQAGEYTLNQRESMGTVLDVLAEGPQIETVRLTIPEGLKLEEIAAIVGELPGRSAERFLELARDGTVRSQYQGSEAADLEGLILPETYFLNADDDEEAILRRLVQEFDGLASQLGITQSAEDLGVTPYEAIIVASLVEREARVPQDRGPVARVIYNRLEQGMLLQIDATVQYALGEQQERLLFSDLEIDSPYNTYRYAGLPPGPIASPGRAALTAALDPTRGDWLYFVLADADGSHVFAETLAEHNRNVAAAREKGLL